MEIILKENIDKLGDAGEMVTVKPGFGRNYLIPQGKAILATPAAKLRHAENERQRAHKVERIIHEAKEIAKKLADVKISIGAKVGESGKIFGSVNAIQVADALKAKGFEIDRKHISIADDAIKTVGTYEAQIKLHKEVTQSLSFEVVGE